jgi:hypothetical protein
MSKSSSSGRNRIGLWFRRTFGNKQGESADAGLESSSGIGLSTRDKVLPVAPTERNETTTALMENPGKSSFNVLNLCRGHSADNWGAIWKMLQHHPSQ